MLSLVVYMYAILGTIMFAHNDPFHFGSLHLSVLTLFRVATLEGWSGALCRIINHVSLSSLSLFT